MFSLEETLTTACASRSIPNAIVHAADRKGKFTYSGTFGVHSLKTAEPLKDDAVFWIASCTKLLTSIAVMQSVERGLLTLDEDVSDVLHELKGIEVLEGFGADGRPRLRKAEAKITLRHLLTHSSGLSYDLFNPTLMRYCQSLDRRLSYGKTVQEKYRYPLLFEPGTAWTYGVGLDWAGLMVERVNGGLSLEEYMKLHIWEPLGIKAMAFHLEKREDLRRRMPDMCRRDPTTGKAVFNGKAWDDPAKDAFGGAGLYASMPDYMKVLRSLLTNDQMLVKSETLGQMCSPQLSEASRQSMMKQMEDPELNDSLGGLPLGAKRDYSLAGLLLQEDLKDWRRKGTVTWGGVPNLTWWIDREAGLCGIYGSQIIPPGDLRSVKMSQLFERTIYERFSKGNPRL